MDKDVPLGKEMDGNLGIFPFDPFPFVVEQSLAEELAIHLVQIKTLAVILVAAITIPPYVVLVLELVEVSSMVSLATSRQWLLAA